MFYKLRSVVVFFKVLTLFYVLHPHTHTQKKFCFQVKEQVQADVVITSAAQDERLLKILHGQGTFTVMHIFYSLFQKLINNS